MLLYLRSFLNNVNAFTTYMSKMDDVNVDDVTTRDRRSLVAKPLSSRRRISTSKVSFPNRFGTYRQAPRITPFGLKFVRGVSQLGLYG